MTRLPVLLCTLAALTAGCSDDPGSDEAAGRAPVTGASATPPPGTGAATLTEAEIRSLLESELRVQWEGSGEAGIVEQLDDDAPPVSRRLALVAGDEVDLLLYATPQDAREAWPAIRRTEVLREGGAAARAANAVLVLDDAPKASPATDRAWRLFRRLGDACTSPDARTPDALVRRCFDPGQAPPPPAGTGADRGETAPEGSTVRLGGIGYRVVLARRLNPALSPDRALVGPRRAAPGFTLLGVFLRACNRTDATARATGSVSLTTATGRDAAAVRLPTGNVFAYRGGPVAPDACRPTSGSAPDVLEGGGLVLFDVPEDLLEDRPVAVRLRAGGDERLLAIDL